MPGINTTGNPNTDDYNLGRGIVYFAALGTNGLPSTDGYEDLGNAPQFTVSMEVEDLDHFSSRTGLKVLDKKFIISQSVNITFQLDELRYQNIARFLSGDTSLYNNGHDTVFSDVVITTGLVQGRWYDLWNSPTLATRRRVYDLNAAGFAFTFEESTPTPMVESVDYILDRIMGRIQVVVGSIVATNGDTIQWTSTVAATTPADLDQVDGLTDTLIEGALKFISDNPGSDGNRDEYQFHKVQIRADGDLSLIGDEVTVMGFAGAALVNNAVTDTSKVVTVRTYTPQP